MRKIKSLVAVLFAAAIGTGIYAFGINNDVPQKVKDAFAQKFPGVKKVKWEKENDKEWEGEFKKKGMEYSANFLEDGTWKETEHEIKKSDIPANIKTALIAEFPDYKIEDAEISETSGGSVYEFEIEKIESEMEVVIDMKGKIFIKEIKDENY